MPDFFHIIPVCDDSVFNWVFQGKDTSFALCFISNIGIFLSHSNHDTLVTGSTNDGWEDSTWGIVSGESGFAHTGAIVNNKSGNFVVTHFVLSRVFDKSKEFKISSAGRPIWNSPC